VGDDVALLGRFENRFRMGQFAMDTCELFLACFYTDPSKQHRLLLLMGSMISAVLAKNVTNFASRGES